MRWRANLITHGKDGLLLLLWQLRCLLLICDLLLNNRLTILVLLVLVHDVCPRVEILLALVAPGTFNFEALVVRGSEATRLSHPPEVVICEAECPILERSLIIFLTLIGYLGTQSFLELRLGDDPICSSTLALVILPVDMGADHSCQVWWLVGASASEVAAWAFLGSSIVLGPIDLNHRCSLRISAFMSHRRHLHVDGLSSSFAAILSPCIPPLRILLIHLL